MQKITPYLWFDNNAEEAVNFYTSIFKNARVIESSKLENAGPNGDDVFTAVFDADTNRKERSANCRSTRENSKS